MIVIIEDVIRLLDATSESLRRGHYPDRATAKKTAQLLRAVASDLEV
jgi:CspA family cold shock protein